MASRLPWQGKCGRGLSTLQFGKKEKYYKGRERNVCQIENNSDNI